MPEYRPRFFPDTTRGKDLARNFSIRIIKATATAKACKHTNNAKKNREYSKKQKHAKHVHRQKAGRRTACFGFLALFNIAFACVFALKQKAGNGNPFPLPFSIFYSPDIGLSAILFVRKLSLPRHVTVWYRKLVKSTITKLSYWGYRPNDLTVPWLAHFVSWQARSTRLNSKGASVSYFFLRTQNKAIWRLSSRK